MYTGACAYNTLTGKSCTSDQGSSELVSPLKAFLPKDPRAPLLRIWKEGKWLGAAPRQKCESLILNKNEKMKKN